MRVRRAAALLCLAALGCEGGRVPPSSMVATGGDAQRGATLIRAIGCGQCHVIPGVRGADGEVAPPLARFAQRTFIAGELPNTPDNLVRWLRDPPAIEPRTAMPALGLSEQQARDIAAYLYAKT